MTFASYGKINKLNMVIFRQLTFAPLWLLAGTLIFASCASNPLGQKVKEPFAGSKYESNNRFYRATGMGMSKMDAVANSQAEMRARQQLAQQVQTYFEVVTDDYQRTATAQNLDEAMTRFETLAREITSTTITDMRQIGKEKYAAEDGAYTVYVAIEIKKASMYRHMKKQARLDAKISPNELELIEGMLNELIEAADSAD